MTDNRPDAVVLERTLAAPPERVWELWTVPEHFEAWYGPDGATIHVATMDVRVGGDRLVEMRMPTPDDEMSMWFGGEHREVSPALRLAYSEAMTDASGRTLAAEEAGLPSGHPVLTEVTVELAAVDAGTHLTLTHAGIPADSPGATGWAMALDKLVAALEGDG
ncbi:MAG: SRPBCC domain-containing protein [Acidimicrobiales bacterium]|nr:SRPBCC domain-containing protein [Acidimicrobiales bacterium]